jgi:hypothetical protein
MSGRGPYLQTLHTVFWWSGFLKADFYLLNRPSIPFLIYKSKRRIRQLDTPLNHTQYKHQDTLYVPFTRKKNAV